MTHATDYLHQKLYWHATEINRKVSMQWKRLKYDFYLFEYIIECQ